MNLLGQLSCACINSSVLGLVLRRARNTAFYSVILAYVPVRPPRLDFITDVP
jgi:hypothetical protein